MPQQDWEGRALCRDYEPELFFPTTSHLDTTEGRRVTNAREAQRICARCPVARECGRYALATRQAYGVWGGMTQEDRHNLTRARG